MGKPPDSTVKSGDERFFANGKPLSLSLLGFWRWAYSELLNNTQRGILAEYLVKEALQVNYDYRVNWTDYDLTSTDGLKIEVKSASYLQSWQQKQLSAIRFDIAKKSSWTEENGRSSSKNRSSDIYIFCLLKEKDEDKVNPLNLDQWEFLVIRTKDLDENCGEQQSIGLNPLLRLNPVVVKYDQLHAAVSEIAKGFGQPSAPLSPNPWI